MEYMLMDLNINVEEHFKQLNKTDTNNNNNNTSDSSSNNNNNNNNKSKSDTFMENFDISSYGLPLEEVYNLARSFLKEKEGKAIHLTYDDRNMFNILPKQIYFGKYREEADKNIGFLDLVGKDRLQLWKSLGDMPKDEAMKKYILLLVNVCPLFHTSMEAHKRNLEEEKRKKEEEEELLRQMSQQRERKLKEDEFKFHEENKKKREEMQKKQIQEALNQQTYPHFKAYAEQQHPNNQIAQQELIKQLQEQHFEQYMNQVYQQQLLHQQQQAEQLRAIRAAQKAQRKQQEQSQQQGDITNLASANTTADDGSFGNNLSGDSVNLLQALNSINLDVTNNNAENSESKNLLSQNDEESNDEEEELPPISAATMITKKEIKEFKDLVKKDNDAIIKIGSGETVTVRVPTHEDGRFLYWEFATDYYDIGFGLYFEWTISPSNNVTVQVSDSSDDEELEEGASEESKAAAAAADIEKGKSNSNKPPCDEIIPIFRRDSHLELYAGSHIYPGRGVYLLKFDNSYSLWRSKTLYYRVYYSK